MRDLWVGTFHSICARLLRRYAVDAWLSPNFVIYDDADQKAVMSRILKEKAIDEKVYPPRYVLSKIHAEKQEAKGPGESGKERGFDPTLQMLYEAYERALALANAVVGVAAFQVAELLPGAVERRRMGRGRLRR